MEKVEETSGQLELWRDSGTAGQRDGEKAQPSRRQAVPPSRSLQRALDRIHTRYGVRGVTRGSQLAALTARTQP